MVAPIPGLMTSAPPRPKSRTTVCKAESAIKDENEMTDLAEKLDKLIEVLSRPAIPADRVLWDAAAAAAYLGVSARHVAERYALTPGFPDTIRLPSEHGRGQLRWKAVEVMAWAERQRPKTVPRSRKAA